MSIEVLLANGYKSFTDFAKKNDISRGSINRHFDKGYCDWPRVRIKGQTKHPLYAVWNQMRQRCRNSNYRYYNNYGGRGIKVCPRWDISFEWFLEDVGERPSTGHSLDRIDNEGNYEPGNVKWSTRIEQMRNTRKGIGNIYYMKQKRLYKVTHAGNYIGKFKELRDAQEALDKYINTLVTG